MRPCSLALPVLLFSFLPGPAARAQDGPHALFEVLGRAGDGTPTPRTTGATAEPELGVRVRPEVLAVASPGGRLRLDLAPGVTTVGVIEDIHRTLLGRLVVAGRVAGRPGGHFTLVANGTTGEMAGRVRLGAGEIYHLGHPPGGGPGLGVRRQGAAVAGCGGEVEPPLPATPLLPHTRALPAPAPADAGPTDGPNSYDLMVVYTAAARQGAGGVEAIESLCELAMENCNEAYANSGLSLRGRLVHTMETPLVESGSYVTDLNRLASGTLVSTDDVAAARDQYGADFVSLFVAGEGASQDATAGLGFLNAGAQSAFTICFFRTAPDLVLAHEIGHNMGCAHDAANTRGPGAYPYSYGWRWTGIDGFTYHDVMAYAPGDGEPYFSSPLVTFQGVPTGDVAQADNARTIALRAPLFTNFRRATVGLQGAPLVSVTAVGSEAIKETGQPACVVFTRAGGDLSAPLTVGVGAVSGRLRRLETTDNDDPAAPGLDYQAPPATLIIPAGQAAAELLLTPIAGGRPARYNDTARLVDVVVRPGEGYVAGSPAAATVGVYDLAPGLAVAAAPPAHATQSPIQAAEVVVSRIGPADRALTFSLAVDGAAYDRGHALFDPPVIRPLGGGAFVPSVFTLPAGAASFAFRVSVPADATLPAAGEGLRVALDGGGFHYDADQVARVTVLPAAPQAPAAVVSVTANGTRALEGGAPVTVKIARAGGDLGSDLVVAYRLSGPGAGGLRLAPLSGTVVIPAGAAKAKVKVRALDDGVPEPDQSLKFKLVAGASYSVGGQAKVKVIVADPAP